MTTAFPTALDDFANPTPSQSMSAGPRTHSQQHGDLTDAIEAIEARVGIAGSTDPNSVEYRLLAAIAPLLPVGTSTLADSIRNIFHRTGGIPVTLYASDATLAIDATAAINAAIVDARASGNNAVYFPGGRTYRIAAASSSIDPGTADITFYGDGWSSQILFEEGTGTGDINTQRKNLFRNNANVTKGSVQFRSLRFVGTWASKGYVEGGGCVLFLDYYDGIVIENCRFENLSWMATCCEYAKNVRVIGCTFDTICRDIVRFRSSFNVQVIGNKFRHGVDDCVALHSNSNLSGGQLREGIIVANNVFEDTGGIKVLAGRLVSIHHNVMRRVKGFPVAVYSDVGSASEANSAIFGISITDNQLYDSLNLAPFTTAISQAILVGSRVAEAGTDTASVIPGTPTSAGVFQLPWDSRGSTYSSATNGVPPPFFCRVAGNIIVRTLPAVASYSTWGFGLALSETGFVDPAVTDAALRITNGVNVSGQMRKSLLSGNIISHVGAGIGLVDEPLSNFGCDDLVISDNLISDFVNSAIRLPTPAALRTVNVTIKGNAIDGDPYHNHTNRAAAGAWTADGSPAVISCTSYKTIRVIGNAIRNVCRVVDNLGGSGVMLRDNILRCAPAAIGFSASNKGIGNIIEAGVQCSYEHVNSDPTSATYGDLLTAIEPLQAAMPSTGTYVRGAFVQAANSTTLLGWRRLTTGSAHVAGTDWKTVVLT